MEPLKLYTMILVNKIQCNICLDIITSRYRHDYKKCMCGAVGIDGGYDYLRRVCNDSKDYKDLSIKSDDGFDSIRKNLERFDSIKKTYVKLKDIDDNWLEHILKHYVPPNNNDFMDDNFLIQYLREKQWRLNKELLEETFI